MKRFFLFFLLLAPAAAPAAETFSRTQVLMGDVPVTLTVETSASQKEEAYSAMDKAFDEAKRLENSVSEWREGSQATRLNRYAGKSLVPIDRDMSALLLKAREISTMTDGAFDITFASPCRKKKPACLYDYRDVFVAPELGLAAIKTGMSVGVSGIAKGYIVDAMARTLKNEGFRKFLVNAGDIYAAGRWTLGIRDPEKPGSDESICQITVTDRAVSTSGRYERGNHIIDPKTNRPETARQSATVVAPTSTEADALAKGFFILDKEKSDGILKERPDLSAIVIDDQGSIDARNLSPRDNFRCRPF